MRQEGNSFDEFKRTFEGKTVPDQDSEHPDFGGSWTREKLAMLEEYLRAYMKLMAGNERARYFEKVYVDAFAGAGYTKPGVKAAEDNLFPEFEDRAAQEFIEGSTSKALAIEPAFDRFLFIDKDPRRVQSLRFLRQKFPTRAEAIQVERGDSNAVLLDFCENTDWQRTRAVVFLDPYGMQVEWKVLEALGETGGVDLWLLFPLGLGVNRLLTRSGEIPQGWRRRLDLFFGTRDWEQAFYRRSLSRTLFGDEEQTVRTADYAAIQDYFIQRLGQAFAGVAPNPRTLENSTGNPMYLLFFACSNKRGAGPALRIANHILTVGKQRKGSKRGR